MTKPIYALTRRVVLIHAEPGALPLTAAALLGRVAVGYGRR